MKSRCDIGSLARATRGKKISMEVKRCLKNSIFLPTFMYGSETCTWNRAQQLRVHAVKNSYLRGECR